MRITVFLLFFASFLTAQNASDRTIYLDSSFVTTTENNHVYYRIISDYAKTQPTYKITDYYKSGQMRSEGYSTSKESMVETGIQTEYYKNGVKKSEQNYEESEPEGLFKVWYDNGNPKLEGEYIVIGIDKKDQKKIKNETKLKIDQFWNPDKQQTVKDGNGYCSDVSEEGCDEGMIKDGYKDGVWMGSEFGFKYTYVEQYADNKLVSGTSTKEGGEHYDYTIVEDKPEYPGGINEFYRYVAKNFKAPEERGLNGKVVISFVVEKDGKAKQSKIIRSMGPQVDAEAIRIVDNCKPWKPGKKRGILVRTLYSLPINITSAD